jgi:hypothetical protein
MTPEAQWLAWRSHRLDPTLRIIADESKCSASCVRFHHSMMTRRHSLCPIFSARCLLLALTCLLASCSGFNREWRQALASDKPAPGAITGAWEGTWRSEVNGHHGKLRCIVAPEARPGSGTHDVRYHATWMGFLSAAYSTSHQVKKTPDGMTFSGEQRLPRWAGGIYRYEGTVKKDTFTSTYRCRLDHGVFEMRRAR